MVPNSQQGGRAALFLTPCIGLALGLIHIADGSRCPGILGRTAPRPQLVGTEQADNQNQQNANGDPGDPGTGVFGPETVLGQMPGSLVPELASSYFYQSDPAKAIRWGNLRR